METPGISFFLDKNAQKHSCIPFLRQNQYLDTNTASRQRVSLSQRTSLFCPLQRIVPLFRSTKHIFNISLLSPVANKVENFLGPCDKRKRNETDTLLISLASCQNDVASHFGYAHAKELRKTKGGKSY